MSRKIFCDRCGKEILKELETVKIYKLGKDESLPIHRKAFEFMLSNVEICQDCAKSLVKWWDIPKEG